MPALGSKALYWQKNSITPHSVVSNGMISGRRSNEVKVKVLLAYGDVIRDRLLRNTSYSVVYESNGLKKRPIWNISAKRVKKNARIFSLRNINANEIIDKPTLKLSLDATVECRDLSIKSTRSMKMKFVEVPIQERYKFPKE